MKDPSPSETRRLLKEGEEVMKIREARPNGKRVARDLGPFKTCNERTLIEQEDGKFEVRITSEQATPEENRKRLGVVDEAMAETRRLATERSQRLYEETDHIVVRDERTGGTREIPAAMEEAFARKKWARPGSRKRTYFFFGKAG